ncbi:hypothetical protein BDF14DRAFT_1789811 [Spinellus fusiger]|nr:hypothetical protein BDF14DRAFT_1789811 [Spinellus fusiger]
MSLSDLCPFSLSIISLFLIASHVYRPKCVAVSLLFLIYHISFLYPQFYSIPYLLL